MRKLDKGAPIQHFVDFIRHNHYDRWEDAKEASPIWREHILNREQHGLSGYTEAPIKYENSHIDHFKKQALYPNLIFEWNNYVVDSKDDTYGARYKDNVVCNQTDNERLINPVVENAQQFFKYELSGKMVPMDGLGDVEKQRANYTIDSFNLNESSLMERRKSILNLDLSSFEGLTDHEILEALQPDGFISVVEQLINERTKNEEEAL
jgi:uncharacterized protein (TIGR02646 family)